MKFKEALNILNLEKKGQEDSKTTWRGLLGLAKETMMEYLENEGNFDDVIHEVVDSAVPVYYSQQFDLLEDSEGWNAIAFQELELGGEPRNLVEFLGMAIYEALYEAVYQMREEILSEVGVEE